MFTPAFPPAEHHRAAPPAPAHQPRGSANAQTLSHLNIGCAEIVVQSSSHTGEAGPHADPLLRCHSCFAMESDIPSQMAPKHYACRRGREGAVVVFGWNEFQSRCLGGLAGKLKQGEDWEAFENPADAADWLENNKIENQCNTTLEPETREKQEKIVAPTQQGAAGILKRAGVGATGARTWGCLAEGAGGPLSR